MLQAPRLATHDAAQLALCRWLNLLDPAQAYRVEDIDEANANGSNEKIITIVHKEGTLDLEVSSPKVRDYLVRMLNKLFTIEKNRSPDAGEEEEAAPAPVAKKKAPKSRGDDDDRGFVSLLPRHSHAHTPQRALLFLTLPPLF